MLSNPLDTSYHVVQRASQSRKLAYTDRGHFGAAKTFVCLPGLLETRANFAPLLALAESHDNCRWISIDHCGRGDSDPACASESYCMSMYMQDVEDFLHGYLFNKHPNGMGDLFLVGTSMGGILAMYLANKFLNRVAGIVLNDIGLTLYWWSLYGLYKGLNNLEAAQPEAHRQVLESIHPQAIQAVQSSTHFDLKYDFDWLGMHFHGLLKNFPGQVLLLHNDNSLLCPTDIAHHFKSHVPQLAVLSLEDDRHPAVWTPTACQWLCAQMGLHRVLTQPALNPIQLPLFNSWPTVDQPCAQVDLTGASNITPSPPSTHAPFALDERPLDGQTLKQFLTQSAQHLSSTFPDKAMTSRGMAKQISMVFKSWFQ